MFILKKRRGGQTLMGTKEEKDKYRYIIGVATSIREGKLPATDFDHDIRIENGDEES